MTIGARSAVSEDDPNHPTSLSVAVAASILGLHPVKLEQRYLVLYSMYATHMGQGKEAAQIATKHVISDLQKKAVVWDAMPSPSQVAPTVTVNTVDHALLPYNLW